MLFKIADEKKKVDILIQNRGIGMYEEFYSNNENLKPIIYDCKSLEKYLNKVKKELKKKYPMLKHKEYFDGMTVKITNLLHSITISDKIPIYGDFIVNGKHYSEVVKVESQHTDFFYSFNIVFDVNGDAFIEYESIKRFNKEEKGVSKAERIKYKYSKGFRLNRLENVMRYFDDPKIYGGCIINFVTQYDHDKSDYTEFEKRLYEKYIRAYCGV